MTAVLLSGQASAQQADQAQDYPYLDGKTALVTGATDGLGREVAIRLGALGAHVLVHGRNVERADEVVAIINRSRGSAEFFYADFARLDDVRDLAAEVITSHRELHLLINNAGIGSGFADGQRMESEDGHEMIFQVNYLAHFLLTEKLLPLLKSSAPARIVNVASGAQSPVDFDDIMLQQNFEGRTAYAQSKLAQVLHTFHLAEELEGSGVTVNTLHPATMMDTTMVAMSGRPAQTTVDEGATALMHLAVAPQMEGRTGLYFSGLNEAQAHEQAYDPEARRRLMALSRDLTDLE